MKALRARRAGVATVDMPPAFTRCRNAAIVER
jgi:hypothetical protein